jgi:predicted transcriptional regulator
MNVTGAESEVMAALWEKSPRTVDEIVSEVGPRMSWGEATVKTLLNRLLKKKIVKSEQIDGRRRYSPLLSRADYVQTESQNLLDRLFEGELAPLVAHFAQQRSLKPEEAERIRQIIEGLDRG